MFLPGKLLKHLIREGRLTVIDADGQRYVYEGASWRAGARPRPEPWAS